jgi:NAD(P)-dependent dehydrogenase (short-subunit alcohol dehydrogenase family)
MANSGFEDKHALVTGAGGGIGSAFVDALLEAGAAKVYAASRGRPAPGSDRERVTPVLFDVTNETEVAAAAAQIPELDLLVNSAGTLTPFDVASGKLAGLQADLDVHVLGPLRVARALAPQLEANGGAIVNILSVAALASIPGLEASAASKAAVFSLTQALRAQLRPRGVTVHAVFPGAVDTPLIAAFDIPKSPALEVARETLAAVAAGKEDVFPDPNSRMLADLWGPGPKRVERALANPSAAA